MADSTFRAIISVVNKATAPLRAIAHSVHSLHGAAEHAGEKLGHLGEKLGDILKPLSLLGAGLSAAGLVEFAKHAAESGAAVFDASLKTGIGAEQLSAWHFAAKEAGVEAESFDKGMVKLNRTVAEAAVGKNQDARALFQKLGISLKDAHGHMRSASDLLPQLAKAFEVNENPALRARMAIALFGKAGADLIPLLALGEEALQEAADKARFLGLTFSDEAAAGAKEFKKSWEGLEGGVQGLANAIGGKLFPILKPLIDDLTKWIATNREFLAQKVGAAVTEIADALRQVDWGEVARQLGAVARAIGSVIAWLGPMGTAIAAAVIFLGPLIVAVGQATYALYGLAAALVAAFGWNVGLILAAIAAVAFAVYEIYEHWTPIKAFFKELWEGVTALFQAAWEKIKSIVDAVKNAAEWLASAGRRGADVFQTAMTAVPQEGDVVDPGTGMVLSKAPSRPLYGPGGAAAGAAANGQVDVNITLDGAPAGTRVTAKSTGSGVRAPEVDVGYSGLALGY